MDDHEDSENRGCPPISLGKKENNMNTNFFRILIGTIAILSICRVNAEASEIIIKCKADLAFMSSEPVSIKIIKENQGMIQSEINGKISNKNVKVAIIAIVPAMLAKWLNIPSGIIWILISILILKNIQHLMMLKFLLCIYICLLAKMTLKA